MGSQLSTLANRILMRSKIDLDFIVLVAFTSIKNKKIKKELRFNYFLFFGRYESSMNDGSCWFVYNCGN